MSALAAGAGVLMLVLALGFMSRMESVPAPVILFGVVWALGLIGIVVYHVMNATRPKGVPTEIIESEGESLDSRSATERLEELEGLRRRQLISEAEYNSKRQKILSEL
jgi:hypothetical protein